jgi:hypothetical protein
MKDVLMRLTFTYLAIAILLLACKVISQTCQEIQNEKIAAQFLVDHKANSRAADRHCVDATFATLSFATQYKKKTYIEFLAGMFDFERWTPEDYAEASEQKYPAINAVHHLSGVGKNLEAATKHIKDMTTLYPPRDEERVLPSHRKAVLPDDLAEVRSAN